MRAAVVVHAANAWHGCRDSLAFAPACQLLVRSAGLRALFWRILFLNGVVICGSLCFFKSVGSGFTALLQMLPDGPTVTPIFTAGFTALFKFAWMWPVRLLALAFNCVWTIRVFDEANKARDVKPPGTAQGYDRLLMFIAEYAYQCVLILFFFIEAYLWGLLPYVGTPISFVFFCWLHALYAFDYRWAYEGKSLQTRVKAFELRWDYFFGFGAPMTLLYFVLCNISEDGPFVAFGVTSCLFPLHVILSLSLTLRPVDHQCRLNIFSHFAMRGVHCLWYLVSSTTQ